MPQDELDPLLGIAAEVRQGATRLAWRMRADRSAGALSTSKLSVLGHLRRRGPATAGELAAAERQHPQSLTRVLAELERHGLVSRTRGQRDRRQAVLTITPAGQDALGRDMAERDRWLAAALSGLSATERTVLVLAGRLMDEIADRPGP